MTAAASLAGAKPSALAPIDVETDLLVVGGGIMGTTAAFHLAGEGVEVAVIDREDLNGQSSGRTAGNIHGQIGARVFEDKQGAELDFYAHTVRIFARSAAAWDDLTVELRKHDGSDVEVIYSGGLMVAETEEELRLLERKVAYENANGMTKNRLIDGAELRRIAPYVSEKLIGADYSPTEGHANPNYAVPAIARAAAARGVRFFRHAEAQAIERTNTGFVVRTSRGTVRAKRVFNAAGAWCERIAAMVGVAMPMLREPIQMLVTEPLNRFVGHLLYHSTLKLTMKQAANGNVVIGGAWPATFGALGKLPVNLRASVQGSAWIATRVMPDLKQLRLLRGWTGQQNATRDGMPVLCAVPKVPGFFVGTFPGYGFTGGPLFGRLAAELIQGRAPSYDLAPFDLARFG